MMNYKIRIRIAFSVIIYGDRNTENSVWTCKATRRARVAIEKRLLSQCVSQPDRVKARVFIISGRSMNIAAFSTRDLREQGRKSYKAIANQLSFIRSAILGERKLAGWSLECFLVNYVNVGDSRPRTIPNNTVYQRKQRFNSIDMLDNSVFIHAFGYICFS